MYICTINARVLLLQMCIPTVTTNTIPIHFKCNVVIYMHRTLFKRRLYAGRQIISDENICTFVDCVDKFRVYTLFVCIRVINWILKRTRLNRNL